MNFRRKPNTTFKEFLIEFQLKANKVKLSGTALSDGVLGYTLLKCANLPLEKEELIRTTCAKLDLKSVQKQLDKLSFSDHHSSKHDSVVKFAAVKTENIPAPSNNKIEQTFYQNQSSASSDDDFEEKQYDAYFGRYNQRSNKSFHSTSGTKSFQQNPLDKYGHVTGCGFCKCIYHWIPDCPYAPDSVKANARRRSTHSRQFSNSYTKKPL